MQIFATFIKDLLFPQQCMWCSKPGAYACQECLATISRAALSCPFCGCITENGETCTQCKKTHSLDGCVSLFDYADPKTIALVDALKFKKIFSVCETLGAPLAELCLTIFQVSTNFLLIPAPQTKHSFRDRGFNQSEELAKEISRHMESKIQVLLAMKGKAVQHSLTQSKRWKNISERVFVKRFAKIPVHAMVVDDLKTTGATLEACAKALKSRGAKSVWGVTLASQKKILD